MTIINKKMKYKEVLAIIIAITIIIVGIPFLFHSIGMSKMSAQHLHNNSDLRVTLAAEQKTEIRRLISDGKYRCCLENPCSRCFLEDSEHGDGTACDCLDEVIGGEAPCGECIGEILEGEGNKYLKEYFPEAIAEKIGEEYLDVLESIIDEKYGV